MVVRIIKCRKNNLDEHYCSPFWRREFFSARPKVDEKAGPFVRKKGPISNQFALRFGRIDTWTVSLFGSWGSLIRLSVRKWTLHFLHGLSSLWSSDSLNFPCTLSPCSDWRAQIPTNKRAFQLFSPELWSVARTLSLSLSLSRIFPWSLPSLTDERALSIERERDTEREEGMSLSLVEWQEPFFAPRALHLGRKWKRTEGSSVVL